MDEAIKIADTIVLMKEGEIVQSGRPEQILRHPANEFVKNFIGKQRLRDFQHADLENMPVVDEVLVENPATVYPSRGLAEALTMLERRRVDTLLVVDRSNQLLGSVTIYQLLEHYKEENKTVADIMKPVSHTIASGSSLADALQIMSEKQLSNLAVVKNDNEFVGLLTRGSVVGFMADVYVSNGIGGESA